MKLTIKLLTLFLAIAIALLAVDAYSSYRRERDFLAADLEHDARMLAHALKAIVRDVWTAEGAARVDELLADVNARQPRMRVRLVRLAGGSAAAELPELDRRLSQRLADPEDTIAIIERTAGGVGRHATYLPVRIEDLELALEIAQPMDEMDAYVRGSLYSSLLLAGALALVGVFSFVPLGLRMLGRPLSLLREKARAVGAGDLSNPVRLESRDELGELAAAMNQMCDQLAASQEQLRTESAERIAAVERLRHADRLRMVGQLVSGVAHELGTPLNVVSGRASQIAGGRLAPEDAAEAAKIIKEQSRRMTEIIRQLLHFARRPSPNRSVVDLRQLARRTVSLLEPIAGKRDVDLRLEGDATAPAHVDASQLEQVLTNLLINGIDAMPDGGEVTVSIHHPRAAAAAATQAGGRDLVRIDVCDQGSGIAADHLDRLFEPFFTTKDVGRGTGLGLSIALGIVEEHGGWIEVESELGQGSRFSVYLPLDTEE